MRKFKMADGRRIENHTRTLISTNSFKLHTSLSSSEVTKKLFFLLNIALVSEAYLLQRTGLNEMAPCISPSKVIQNQ